MQNTTSIVYTYIYIYMYVEMDTEIDVDFDYRYGIQDIGYRCRIEIKDIDCRFVDYRSKNTDYRLQIIDMCRKKI